MLLAALSTFKFVAFATGHFKCILTSTDNFTRVLSLKNITK